MRTVPFLESGGILNLRLLHQQCLHSQDFTELYIFESFCEHGKSSVMEHVVYTHSSRFHRLQHGRLPGIIDLTIQPLFKREQLGGL